MTFSSGRELECKYGEKVKASPTVAADECWLCACDVTVKPTARGTGGGCAIQWSPEDIAEAKTDP